MFPTIINALRETLYMVLYAGLISTIIGVPLGMFLANIATSQNRFAKGIYLVFYSLLQLAKSIPYLLVMLLFIPTTNWLINHHISYTSATILPLATTGSLFLASEVYAIFLELSAKWRNTTKALGATKQQSLWLILFPESLAGLIQATANTFAVIVGFSVVAGALGAGGLGQLAIEKALSQTGITYVVISIALLLAIQQVIKYTGVLVVQQTSR